ncbi:type II secretion system protein N [Vibrio paucivorans]|uniref:Type II secretion system protein N n=1 Tax=Vibrio paucivorans TaxID=2829489 RepID=A0A9X3CCX3_9VIBR|nr:type II secretion system protein N [Vibrio paucivorans]MCW8333345.1 type II secretion system protein N [Vibrio paucivorans]
MKRIVLVSALVSVVFSTSVVVHTPASFVVNYLPNIPSLSLSGVSGTIWNGKVNQVEWQGNSLGEVQWHLKPLKLLTGKAEADVRFGRGSEMNVSGKGTVGYGFSGPYANNLVASVPADYVMQQIHIPVPLTVAGQLELSIKQLAYAAPYCQTGEGALVWNAASATSPLGGLELGPVVAQLSCQDSVVSVQGDQQSEQVSAEFSATLQADNRYSAQAWFKPGAQFPEGLQSQLKWLPSPDSQGRYQFNYQAKL